MIPTEDAKKILRWLDARTNREYKDFFTEVDPEKSMMRLRMVCRICRYPVMFERCWKRRLWDKRLAEIMLAMAQAHSRFHNKEIIRPS
jgi:hypothetical protein